MIEQKVPHIDLSQYNVLDHMNGRCDYDSYDRYDAEFHDEALDFGHMFSEAVPSTYVNDDVILPNPEEPDDEELYDPSTNLEENDDDHDFS